MLGLGSWLYMQQRAQLVAINDASKIATTKAMTYAFYSWLDEHSASLHLLADLLKNADDVNFLMQRFLPHTGFEVLQFLKDDGEMFANGARIAPSPSDSKKLRLSLIWFKEAKLSEQTSISFMPSHALLKKPTLNICLAASGGVLCGVVGISDIFAQIKAYELAQNATPFIATHSGEILTPMDDVALKKAIQARLGELFLRRDSVSGFLLDGSFISVAEIPMINWYIGVAADDRTELLNLLSAFSQSGILLLISFGSLMLLANGLHNFMYRRIQAKSDEYEALLAHRAKMSEAGELISGISHQLTQPINSLNLMLSTASMLKQDGKIDSQALDELLRSGSASVRLINETIQTFRNFYKSSDEISEFSLKRFLNELLVLLHTELASVNVSLKLCEFDELSCCSNPSVIGQILLILIHNAKDATLERHKSLNIRQQELNARQIFIEVEANDALVKIRVIDWGIGIDSALAKRIFKGARTTKKQGSGLGLFFAKKLAIKSLNGDLRLKHLGEPTIFELEFLNLKEPR